MQEMHTSIGEDKSLPSGIASAQESNADESAHRSLDAGKRKHGWLSLLRSFLIFDPLIWLYTIFLGIVSIPASFAGDKERTLHNFASFWSWLIMKTIQSPV